MSKHDRGKPHPKPSAPPPEFFEVAPSKSAERTLPMVANIVNVSGTTDMLTIDFYYVHPHRISRIETMGGPDDEGRRDGDTFYIDAEPVARLAVPITTATELILQMFKTMMFGMPRLMHEFESFGPKMTTINELASRFGQGAAKQEAAQEPSQSDTPAATEGKG